MTNWEAIGAIGEIAGAVGVILTLLYLSVQLRQSTKAAKITAIQSSTENSARFSELLSTDDELAEVFWRGLANPDELTKAERRKFVSALNVFMRRESVAFYLHKEGTMPDHLWAARMASISGSLNQPGLRLYLDAAAESLPADFREFLEALLTEDSRLNDQARELLFGRDT